MWTWAGCTSFGGTNVYPSGGVAAASETTLQTAMASCIQVDASVSGPYFAKSLYLPVESRYRVTAEQQPRRPPWAVCHPCCRSHALSVFSLRAASCLLAVLALGRSPPCTTVSLGKSGPHSFKVAVGCNRRARGSY